MKKILIVIFFLIPTFSHSQLHKPIFNVKEFGATGNGSSNDQKAIQKAIDACKGTGGTVLFTTGKFLTGQLVLGNDMTLHIDKNATILGIQSDDEEAYPHHLIETRYPNRMLQDCQRRLIYGNHVSHVSITGGGTIHGQGDFKPWMNTKELGTEKDRPSLLAFVGSSHITISNISLIKPACWTQVYIECDSIHLKDVTIRTGFLTPNRDGVDIVDCHQVLIEDCDIQSEDDAICFKSGSEYGCQDIIVRRCIIDKQNVRAGNCFKLGTDGLGSFRNFEISELTLKNCLQNSAFAIESVDGAVIDNLTIRDCNMTHVGQAFFILLGDRCRTVPERKKRIGTISNITIKNIKGNDFTQSYPSIITGITGHNIQTVSFENIELELLGGIDNTDQKVVEYDGAYPEGSKFGDTNAYAFYLRHIDDVSFEGCTFKTSKPDARKPTIADDVKNMHEE